MYAILSVSDKRGLVEFGQALQSLGVRIFSTGNTQRALSAAGVRAEPISTLTSFPELLDGRVKTLHPAVHAGILARRDRPEHLAQLAAHQLATIDLVAVNLYPFAETIARPETLLNDALEQIDIGGPTLIRAAAKNFPAVLPLVDPDDYGPVIAALKAGEVELSARRRLAAKAFAHTAAYDSLIASYLGEAETGEAELPTTLTLSFAKIQSLRYGENPQQAAAFYREMRPPASSIVAARQLQGKELSFNNILDGDAALQIVQSFDAPTVTIVKHTNPCGLASLADDGKLVAAHKAARSGDPLSAFGGIVGLNRPVDAALAEALAPFFYELIVAPDFSEQARAILAAKPNLRLLAVPMQPLSASTWDYRRVSGGLLVQHADSLGEDDPASWRLVTRRAPTTEERQALAFAWQACAFVKSNAIVIAGAGTLYGMGAGQPSRLDSVMIAVRKAGARARGAALASDAFFPKPDGLEAAAKAGVTAVVQPGGSQADDEVIAAADELGMTMLFTGRRHFRH